MVVTASSLAKTGGRSTMNRLLSSATRIALSSACARSPASSSAERIGPAVVGRITSRSPSSA